MTDGLNRVTAVLEQNGIASLEEAEDDLQGKGVECI